MRNSFDSFLHSLLERVSKNDPLFIKIQLIMKLVYSYFPCFWNIMLWSIFDICGGISVRSFYSSPEKCVLSTGHWVDRNSVQGVNGCHLILWNLLWRTMYDNGKLGNCCVICPFLLVYCQPQKLTFGSLFYVLSGWYIFMKKNTVGRFHKLMWKVPNVSR